jgi:predicted metal-dependent enzyme (double-stranded beta helix superfamily)
MAIASVQKFVEEVRALYAAGNDPALVWPKAKDPMARLLADPELAASSKDWPVSDHENLLFYEDPDYGFVVNGLLKDPGRTTRIHDHAHIWVLYGVLTGSEDIVRYDRIDDRSVPDRAEIRQTACDPVVPGAMDIVEPYAIHAEVAGDAGSVAVIMRSAKPGGFNQGRYDPESGRYWESPGVTQIPWLLA